MSIEQIGMSHDPFQSVALMILLLGRMGPWVGRAVARVREVVALRRLRHVVDHRTQNQVRRQAAAACGVVADEAKRRLHVVGSEVDHVA